MTRLHNSNLGGMDSQFDEERLQSLRRRYRAGRLMRRVLRPLLMAVLITALLVGILSVVVELSADARWYALTLPLFFIALEAIYTTQWLNKPRQMALDRLSYRAAELLLLVVLLRIISWIVFAEGIPDAEALMHYLRRPYALFLNTPFIITLVCGLIAWRLAVNLGQIFSRLEVNDFELRFHSLPLAQRKARAYDQPIQESRHGLTESFTRFWLLGGLLLVVAAGISTLEQQTTAALLSPLAAGRANLEPRLLGALLLYFIIGMFLLSQARLMELHARWLVNNVDADLDARQKWQQSSLIILLLVVAVAAFLPIGSTSALSQIVNVLLYWLLFLANVLLFVLVLPFALILALLSSRDPGEVAASLPPIDPASIVPPAQAGSSPFAETIVMLLSSGFWAVFIVIVVLALLFFLRERRQEGFLESAAEIWAQIITWLKLRWLKLRGQARSLQETLAFARRTEVDPEALPSRRMPWRFLRVSGLPPREQIRYFYLSTVRRAGEKGVKRPQAGTPLEYAEDLKERWPEAEEGLEAITGAFLKARYSDKEILEEEIAPVKNTWKEVRRELRQDPDLTEAAGSEEDEEE